MSQPAYRDHLHADARAHVLGAITSAYAAADELANAHERSALIELDRAVALLHEARKFLRNNPSATEEPGRPTPGGEHAESVGGPKPHTP